MSLGSYVRHANFAGSWYSDSPRELATFLQGCLDTGKQDGKQVSGRVRGIISPHAGYSYSGGVAGSSFCNLDPSTIDRVFVLGPSHRLYLDGCALSGASVLETPVGNMTVDIDTLRELHATGKFQVLTQDQDEAEHSMELQYPFLAQVMKGNTGFRVVPIMVGSIRAEKESRYGELLAPYLNDPRTVFVVSSDFCHWGHRFDYQPYDDSAGQIWQSIEAMDKEGMTLIERGDPKAFTTYLKETGNTICGRHPIGLFLNILRHARSPAQVRFVHYKQSERVTSLRGSSVSYAAGVCYDS